MANGKNVTGYTSSLNKFEIEGIDIAKTLNGLMKSYSLNFKDILKIRYFHTHPEPLPLSIGDHRFAESILENTPSIKLEINAVFIIGEELYLASSEY